ncbi:MAG TPA: hypothetical protein VFO76_03595 [Candidatus Kapabacteria bacterium]|nr:hypothetical protein [Candidatus Kapabacteria bacterium]
MTRKILKILPDPENPGKKKGLSGESPCHGIQAESRMDSTCIFGRTKLSKQETKFLGDQPWRKKEGRTLKYAPATGYKQHFLYGIVGLYFGRTNLF